MATHIEGQSSDVPELLIKEYKSNFFVYDPDGKLLFEAHEDKIAIIASRDRKISDSGVVTKEACRYYYPDGLEYEIYL